MTKKEIIRKLAAKFSMTQADAKRIVQGLLDEVTNVIEQEGRVELRGFGIFKAKERKARVARNPKTGKAVHVPAKRVVVFTPGMEMKNLFSSGSQVETSGLPKEERGVER